MLMITFSISFILITIPLNTLNTMRSDEMALKFSLDPESAVFISRIELDGDERYSNSADLTEGMERVERELAEQGYNATLTGVSIYFLWFEEAEENEKQNIMVTCFLSEAFERFKVSIISSSSKPLSLVTIISAPQASPA